MQNGSANRSFSLFVIVKDIKKSKLINEIFPLSVLVSDLSGRLKLLGDLNYSIQISSYCCVSRSYELLRLIENLFLHIYIREQSVLSLFAQILFFFFFFF